MDLFCPGPVNVNEEIKKKYKDISHRGHDFQTLFKRCSKITKQLFSDLENKYTPLFLTGSGTLAIESMILSWKGKGKVLLVQNGFFSEKWESIFQNHTISYETISFGWGNKISIESIRAYLQTNNFQALFVVHHETSTSMINNLEELNQLCNEFSVELLIDGVSSVGMYDISVKKINKLCMIAYSTNKCIGSNPGLSIVFAKTSFLETLPKSLSYLHLNLYYTFSLQFETPFTPCIQNFFMYADAVQMILDDPLRQSSYEKQRDLFLDGCLSMGYEPFIKNKDSQCCWVINISCKEPTKLYEFLYKNHIVVYKCKGQLEKSYIQIAILNKSESDIQKLLSFMNTFAATKTLEGLTKLEETS
jgi:2-aminoethylphosphonate-pyruvate transaminase